MAGRLGRRGAIELALQWMLAMIITVLAMLIIFIIVSMIRKAEVETSEVDPEVYLAKLYHSPQMLNAVDTRIQAARTGIIDRERFTSAHLDESNDYPRSPVAAELMLLDANFIRIPPATLGGENPIYNDKALYDQYFAFAKQNVRGKGGATMEQRIIPVLLKIDAGGRETLTRVYLNITIVRPNS